MAQIKNYRRRDDAKTFSSNPNAGIKIEIPKSKKLSKIDRILQEIELLKEQIGMMNNRHQNDGFMLTHQAQEISVVKSEVAYIQSKIKHNLFVQLGQKATRLIERIPSELIYLAGGIIGTLAILKLLGRA